MYIVKGTIKDIKTGKPIANANISVTDHTGAFLPVNGNNIGRTSDSKGYFNIPVTPPDAFITISYVGYEPLKVLAQTASKMAVFKIGQSDNQLEEVVVNINKPRPRARPSVSAPEQRTSGSAGNKKIWWIAAGVAVLVLGTVAYFIFKKK